MEPFAPGCGQIRCLLHCLHPVAALCLPVMSDVTRILFAIEQGDPSAAEQLLPLVYDELRRLAAQKLAQEQGTPLGRLRRQSRRS